MIIKVKRFVEHSTLFIDIIKWLAVATAMGCIVGAVSAFFIKSLEWATYHLHGFPRYAFLTPLFFLLNTLIVEYLFPKSDVHTTDKVIETIHASKSIPAFSAVKAFIGPILTIASGGSAGKEAPAADFGAAIGSIFGGILRFNQVDRRRLMICGVSAGFAAVFGTPIAAAIFGVEVLFVGTLLYEVLLPAFTAGIISYEVSSYFGVSYFHDPIKTIPPFNEPFFLKTALAGLFFGLCSLLFIEIMKEGKRLSRRFEEKFHLPLWAQSLIGGAVMTLIGVFFSARYLGMGISTIESCLAGNTYEWYLPFLKMLATSVTLNFGGSGGIVTPILFVGAAAGQLFAVIAGLNVTIFAGIGLVAVLSGCAKTPIAASVMAIELFGPTIAPYAAIACIISFIITGNHSMYPSQVSRVKKAD